MTGSSATMMVQKRSKKADSLFTGSATGSFEVKPVAPFDFRLSASFFGSRSVLPVGVGGVSETGALTLYPIVDGCPVKIEIESTGTVEEPHLIVHCQVLNFSGSRLTPLITKNQIDGFLSKIFSLNLDLAPFYKILSTDKRLKKLKRRFYGLKPVLTESVFDSAVWAIVGQQITLSFALTLKGHLAENYGVSVKTDNGALILGPQLERLSRATIEDLRSLQISRNKAEYLLGLTDLLNSGALDLDNVVAQDYSAAYGKLIEVRGIGEWTANYILLRGAGQTDAFPLGDSGLRRAVTNAYNLEAPATNAEISDFSEKFRPYRGLYTLYMWSSLSSTD